MKKIFSLLVAAVAASLLAGCMEHTGYAQERIPVTYAEPAVMPAPGPVVAYNGGYDMHRGVRQSDCSGPNSHYSDEAGGCVHRITDKAVLNRISPRMPIGTDPRCTGETPGYWTTVSGPQGPISIHRTCVYRH